MEGGVWDNLGFLLLWVIEAWVVLARKKEAQCCENPFRAFPSLLQVRGDEQTGPSQPLGSCSTEPAE